MLEAAGFVEVVVSQKPQSAEFIATWLPGSGAEDHVISANVTAVKPGKLPAKRAAGC